MPPSEDTGDCDKVVEVNTHQPLNLTASEEEVKGKAELPHDKNEADKNDQSEESAESQKNITDVNVNDETKEEVKAHVTEPDDIKDKPEEFKDHSDSQNDTKADQNSAEEAVEEVPGKDIDPPVVGKSDSEAVQRETVENNLGDSVKSTDKTEDSQEDKNKIATEESEAIEDKVEAPEVSIVVKEEPATENETSTDKISGESKEPETAKATVDEPEQSAMENKSEVSLEQSNKEVEVIENAVEESDKPNEGETSENDKQGSGDGQDATNIPQMTPTDQAEFDGGEKEIKAESEPTNSTAAQEESETISEKETIKDADEMTNDVDMKADSKIADLQETNTNDKPESDTDVPSKAADNEPTGIVETSAEVLEPAGEKEKSVEPVKVEKLEEPETKVVKEDQIVEQEKEKVEVSEESTKITEVKVEVNENNDKAAEEKLTATADIEPSENVPTSPALSKSSYDATKEEIEDSINFIKNRLSVADPKIPDDTEKQENVEVHEEQKTTRQDAAAEKKEEICQEVNKDVIEKEIETVSDVKQDSKSSVEIPKPEPEIEKTSVKNPEGETETAKIDCIPPVRPERQKKGSVKIPDWSPPKTDFFSYLFGCFKPSQ